MGELPGCHRPCLACGRAVSTWLGDGWREHVTRGRGRSVWPVVVRVFAMDTLLPKLVTCVTLCDSLFYAYNRYVLIINNVDIHAIIYVV